MIREPSTRTTALAGVFLLFAVAGGLVVTQRNDEQVSLDSLLEIWADVARDVDRLGLTVTRISAEREMEIGREIARTIERGRVQSQYTKRRESYVASVGETLVMAAQRKGIRYSFKVLYSREVNAYAIPGGRIYVTTGMLDFLKSEAELAAVLGHEISHVDLKHCIERLQYGLAARKVVGSDLATIAQIGYDLFGLGFSEQQELEADVGGMILAAKARYNPRSAIAVQERLGEIYSSGEARGNDPSTMVGEITGALWQALENYFATHPPATLRVHELERASTRNAPTWSSQRFYVGRKNYNDFRGRARIQYPEEWDIYTPE